LILNIISFILKSWIVERWVRKPSKNKRKNKALDWPLFIKKNYLSAHD
jgi:hypothetical protein